MSVLAATVLLAIIGHGVCHHEPFTHQEVRQTGEALSDYVILFLRVTVLTPKFMDLSYNFENSPAPDYEKHNVKIFKVSFCYNGSDIDVLQQPNSFCPAPLMELLLPGDVYTYRIGPLESAMNYTVCVSAFQTYNETISRPSREPTCQTILLPVCDLFCNYPAGYRDIECKHCICKVPFSGSSCEDPEFFPREVSSWPNGPNSLHIEWILRESSYSSALTTFGFRFSHFEVAWIENSTSPTPNTMSVPLHDRRYRVQTTVTAHSPTGSSESTNRTGSLPGTLQLNPAYGCNLLELSTIDDVMTRSRISNNSNGISVHLEVSEVSENGHTNGSSYDSVCIASEQTDREHDESESNRCDSEYDYVLQEVNQRGVPKQTSACNHLFAVLPTADPSNVSDSGSYVNDDLQPTASVNSISESSSSEEDCRLHDCPP